MYRRRDRMHAGQLRDGECGIESHEGRKKDSENKGQKISDHGNPLNAPYGGCSLHTTLNMCRRAVMVKMPSDQF